VPQDSIEIEHCRTPELEPVPRGLAYETVLGLDELLCVGIARPLGENDAMSSGQRVQATFALLGDLVPGRGGWEFAESVMPEGHFVEEVLSGLDDHAFFGAERWCLRFFFESR
jgi:hypothetical protein